MKKITTLLLIMSTVASSYGVFPRYVPDKITAFRLYSTILGYECGVRLKTDNDLYITTHSVEDAERLCAALRLLIVKHGISSGDNGPIDGIKPVSGSDVYINCSRTAVLYAETSRSFLKVDPVPVDLNDGEIEVEVARLEHLVNNLQSEKNPHNIDALYHQIGQKIDELREEVTRSPEIASKKFRWLDLDKRIALLPSPTESGIFDRARCAILLKRSEERKTSFSEQELGEFIRTKGMKIDECGGGGDCGMYSLASQFSSYNINDVDISYDKMVEIRNWLQVEATKILNKDESDPKYAVLDDHLVDYTDFSRDPSSMQDLIAQKISGSDLNEKVAIGHFQTVQYDYKQKAYTKTGKSPEGWRYQATHQDMRLAAYLTGRPLVIFTKSGTDILPSFTCLFYDFSVRPVVIFDHIPLSISPEEYNQKLNSIMENPNCIRLFHTGHWQAIRPIH